jgi:site-specific DNA-methyltransferase (adenine-specific)
MNGSEDSMLRPLNQYATFVRFNKAISIIEKIKAIKFDAMSESVSNRMPFGLTSKVRPTGKGEVTLYALRSVGKIARSSIHEGKNIIDSWKVLISKGYGEGGESRDYPRMIIGKPIVAVPPSACTETYLVVGTCKSKNDAQNMASYLRTKFLRFLLGLIKNTQNISRKVFAFAPMQDFSEPWTDEKLYEKYRLSKDEISFIESKIRPMEVENEK